MAFKDIGLEGIISREKFLMGRNLSEMILREELFHQKTIKNC